MQTFPKSSFFKECRAPTLPSPAEIRAINKKLGHDYTIAYQRMPPVRISSLGLLVKYGVEVTVAEAETQRMLFEKLQGQVPVPEIFGWAEDGDEIFIYMALIHGDTLQDRWSSMNPDERTAICNELAFMVKAWRVLKQDRDAPYIGSLGNRSLNDVLLYRPGLAGPFQGPNAVSQFHAACGIRISDDDDVSVVFTHADLVLPNILVSSGPNPKIAAIIDWGQAGWYPAYWEYCKARQIMVDTDYVDHATQEELRTKYLPMFLEPVHEETYYHPWLYFLLSRGI